MIKLLICLKGLFTIFFLLFKSHILDSNGVWYSWFWPEGSINGQNSTFLGFHFVPRDLDSRRRGPRLAAQGTSTRGAKGPRLAAPRDLDSRRQWWGTSTSSSLDLDSQQDVSSQKQELFSQERAARGEQIVCLGDARHDSPGFTACWYVNCNFTVLCTQLFTTYSQDAATGQVVSFWIVHKDQVI